MKRVSIIATWIIFVFIFILLLPAVGYLDAYATEGTGTMPYTSKWGDFKTVVPDGWKVGFDFEEKHFTDTNFKSPDTAYSMAIRWYTRYSTHRLSSGVLEMNGGTDDYIRQTLDVVYGPNAELIEQVHDVEVDGLKAKRFVVKSRKIERIPNTNPYINSLWGPWDRLGILVGDKIQKDPGEHVYTLVSSASGIYVLTYYAPQGGYDKYKKEYEQLVASFVRTKDGPGGAHIPGAPSVAEATPLDELNLYMTSFKSLKETLFRGPVSKSILNDRQDGLVTKNLSGWFEDAPLRKEKEIIKIVSTMKLAPMIPEEAKRNFVRASTFMKNAKVASDYKYAIDAYKEALLEAPWWGEAYYNLGMAFTSAGQYDDAIESLNLYLLTKPGEADRNKAQTKIYETEATRDMARQRYENFKQEANQGVSDYRRGPSGYDDAIRHWKKALELSPDDPEIHVVYYNLGEAYMNKGDLDEAYKNMQKAFELKPERPNVGQNNEFGVVLQRRGDRDGACRYYKKGCDAGVQLSCNNYSALSCP